MKFEGLNGKSYQVARMLGRGGEGEVFEIQNEPGFVLKKYSDPISPDKLNKLRYMVAIRTPKIEAYAAWPVDVVRDGGQQPCGFVMRKLSNYLPLHMLFSPMDRKKLFPDKGYNFLVHVAKNLAIAFHHIHEAGLIAGDVNEGNILINESGMVAFIDCDSFQVKQDGRYYFCEVGVPRYTPAELLRRNSFEQVVRTVNTDSFSLAVLIFQLLFLGRHPFAGRNSAHEDMDEEQAIRQFQFAYSLRNQQKKLSPPKDSFSISQLPADVRELFHRAFEQEAHRPSPDSWVRSLDALLKHMSVCTVSSLHSYPSIAGSCPWCAFRAKRGILYFLDGTHQPGTHNAVDAAQYINGFKVDAISFKPLPGNYTNPQLRAQEIDRKYYRAKRRKTWMIYLLLLVACAISLLSYWAVVISFIVIALIGAKWNARLVRTEWKQRKLHFNTLKDRYFSSLAQYNAYEHVVSAYNRDVSNYTLLLENYRNLPQEFQQRKRHMEERIYDKHLHDFLSRYAIRDHSIPSVGAAKKLLLATGGIKTAADISKLASVKVLGIGPVYHQRLLSWQRQVAAQFTYIPQTSELASGTAVIQKEMSQIKAQLDADIRRGHRALTGQANTIQAQGAAMIRALEDMGNQLGQAELDMQLFKQRIL